jgi:hypothetical protein
MKGHLTNRFSKILKVKFVSLLDFVKLKRYSETFPTAAYECVLKSCGPYFDSLLLKTELSIIQSSEGLLRSNISDLLKYFIASNLRTALRKVFCLVINCSNNQFVSRANILCFEKGADTYLRSTLL